MQDTQQDFQELRNNNKNSPGEYKFFRIEECKNAGYIQIVRMSFSFNSISSSTFLE